jgi:hypothetical protein
VEVAKMRSMSMVKGHMVICDKKMIDEDIARQNPW